MESSAGVGGWSGGATPPPEAARQDPERGAGTKPPVVTAPSPPAPRQYAAAIAGAGAAAVAPAGGVQALCGSASIAGGALAAEDGSGGRKSGGMNSGGRGAPTLQVALSADPSWEQALAGPPKLSVLGLGLRRGVGTPELLERSIESSTWAAATSTAEASSSCTAGISGGGRGVSTARHSTARRGLQVCSEGSRHSYSEQIIIPNTVCGGGGRPWGV